MIKITNVYLIGLMTASLLVGCGGGGSDSDKTETTEQAENAGDTESTNDDTQPVEGENGTGGDTQIPTAPPTPTPTPMPTTQPTSTAKTFNANVMPVLEAKCKSCHGDEGKFTITTASATYANISDLKGSVVASGQYLLDKGSQSISHGGGLQIATTSAEYATIKSWVDAGADFN